MTYELKRELVQSQVALADCRNEKAEVVEELHRLHEAFASCQNAAYTRVGGKRRGRWIGVRAAIAGAERAAGDAERTDSDGERGPIAGERRAFAVCGGRSAAKVRCAGLAREREPVPVENRAIAGRIAGEMQGDRIASRVDRGCGLSKAFH